jgi:PEP-CTERM motif
MRYSLYALALAASMLGAQAQAATTVTFTGGGAPLVAGETVFATFNGSDTGGVTGSNFQLLTGDSSAGAEPATGDQGDRYLSVLANGVANFTFTPIARLGLDYGSADTYNTFVLTLLSGATETFTGQQIITTGTADGDQNVPRTNGRLVFSNTLDPIVGLSLRSTQNSLEVDNFSRVSAVPEPSTWALMLIGFGAVGASMRRRRPALRTAQIA